MRVSGIKLMAMEGEAVVLLHASVFVGDLVDGEPWQQTYALLRGVEPQGVVVSEAHTWDAIPYDTALPLLAAHPGKGLTLLRTQRWCSCEGVEDDQCREFEASYSRDCLGIVRDRVIAQRMRKELGRPVGTAYRAEPWEALVDGQLLDAEGTSSGDLHILHTSPEELVVVNSPEDDLLILSGQYGVDYTAIDINNVRAHWQLARPHVDSANGIAECIVQRWAASFTRVEGERCVWLATTLDQLLWPFGRQEATVPVGGLVQRWCP